MKHSHLFLAVLFCILIGHSAKVYSQSNTNASIQTVNVSPDVELTNNIILNNPDTPLRGSGFGTVAATLSQPLLDEKGFTDALKKHDVKLNQIVHERFSSALEKSGLFDIADRPPANATFHLKVVEYGLACRSLSMNLQPVLKVQAKLVGSNGSVLWKKTAESDEMEPGLFERNLEDYLNNGVLLKSSFVDAAEKVSATLIAHLERKFTKPQKSSTPSSSSKFRN